MDGRNGQPYLLPCLRSHEPVDLVVIMLGTNDLKTIFGRQAHEIALGAGTLAEMALGSGTGPAARHPRCCSSRRRAWGADRPVRAVGLRRGAAQVGGAARCTATCAELKGVPFLDAAALVGADPADGVHLGEDAHAVLGHAIAIEARRLLGGSRT